MVGWKESLHSINHLKKPTKETNQQSYFFDLIVKGPILQNKLFKKRTINLTKKVLTVNKSQSLHIFSDQLNTIPHRSEIKKKVNYLII